MNRRPRRVVRAWSRRSLAAARGADPGRARGDRSSASIARAATTSTPTSRGLLRDRSAAEDVTALAFERAWRRRRSYRPARAAAAAPGCSGSPATPRSTSCAAAGGRPGADQRAGRRHRRRSRRRDRSRRSGARRCERRWPSSAARERELVALKFFAGLSDAEIAAVIGTSESNAGTRLHRVIEKLRRACDEAA